MSDVLRQKWRDVLRALGVAPILADPTFDGVREQYAGPGRYYHTLDHVQNVLESVEILGSHAPHLHAVKLAGWFT